MLILGILFVCLTLGAAVAIGMKANQSVRAFDEAHHEHFLGAKGKTNRSGVDLEVSNANVDV